MATNPREEELATMRLAELRELAGDYELETNGLKKAELVDAILEYESDDEVDDIETEDDELDEEEDDEVDDLESDEIDDDEIEDEPAPKKPRKKAAKKDESGEAILAAKQVAALLNTEAKTLRQFFRSPASTTEAVGSGGRYEFLESDVDKIRNEFAAWMENKTTRTRTKSEGGSTRRTRKERVIAEEDIAPEIEELDDELDELEDDFDDELDD